MGIGRAVAAAAIGISGLGLLAACDWDLATESYSDSDGVGAVVHERAVRQRLRRRHDPDAATRPRCEREVHYSDEKPGQTYRVDATACSSWTRATSATAGSTTRSPCPRAPRCPASSTPAPPTSPAWPRSTCGRAPARSRQGRGRRGQRRGELRLGDLADIGGAVVAKAESGTSGGRRARRRRAAASSAASRPAGSAARPRSSPTRQRRGGTHVAEDVRVDAESGNVEVAVPEGYYQVTTSTDSGDVRQRDRRRRGRRPQASTCTPTAGTSPSRGPDAGNHSRESAALGMAGRLSE